MTTHPDYSATLRYLYDNLPVFQRVGASAYKPDLGNTLALCKVLGDPQHQFKSVHIAGTNGKGSSSHMIAAILQSAGYKTGLYTSPHLKDFTERIRINGKEVEQSFVVDFVERIKPAIEEIKPSFFEITVAMAFDYFSREHVDIAVIEVGLGGRLDSTNIITPLVSLITNISYDHKDLLGDTLPKIAFEKAGIIKRNVPVVISEYQSEVMEVFQRKAREEKAPLEVASERLVFDGSQVFDNGAIRFNNLNPQLKGNYQKKNIPGVVLTIEKLKEQGFIISDDHIQNGIQQVTTLTGLKGRWQKLNDRPLMICDTGHNEAGIGEIVNQIKTLSFKQLHMIIGMVKDKDISGVLRLLPKDAHYYFCQANIPRAMSADDLYSKAKELGLQGEVIRDVNKAIIRAKNAAQADDLIFIGGSTFVVAEIEGL
ncbi:MAG TPA: folylpolyglutamate synthase/dihydrofolate synthase family protein [Cyclobacteriaceae bacterium]